MIEELSQQILSSLPLAASALAIPVGVSLLAAWRSARFRRFLSQSRDAITRQGVFARATPGYADWDNASFGQQLMYALARRYPDPARVEEQSTVKSLTADQSLLQETVAAVANERRFYSIADLNLAGWGNNEAVLAERTMKGLNALRDQFGSDRPLNGANIAISLPVTIPAVFLNTVLKSLGAEVSWSSSNVYATQNHAAAALAASGTSVFAILGESQQDYWFHKHEVLNWFPVIGPNMIIDEGGDLTRLIRIGRAAEKDRSLLQNAESKPDSILYAIIEEHLSESPTWYSDRSSHIVGATDGNTVDAPLSYELQKDQSLIFPVIDVSTARPIETSAVEVAISLMVGILGFTAAREADPLHSVVIVCGFGETGGRAAELLRNMGMRVLITEADPIAALQAALEGYEVVALNDRIQDADAVVVATNDPNLLGHDDLKTMKDMAFVCNVSRSKHAVEIDPTLIDRTTYIGPHIDSVEIAEGKRIFLLNAGQPLNLEETIQSAIGSVDTLYVAHVLAQIELFTSPTKYNNAIHRFPRALDDLMASFDEIGPKFAGPSDSDGNSPEISSEARGPSPDTEQQTRRLPGSYRD